MSAILKSKDRNGYLEIVVTGSIYKAEELMEFNTAMIAEAVKYGRNRVLLDMRELVEEVDLPDKYMYAKEVEEDELKRSIRWAGIGAERNIEKMREIAVMLRNRGVLYQPFLDRAEALKWLRGEDSEG